MSQQSMLERVMAANPVPDIESLPEGTIDVRTLRNYVAGAPSLEPATDTTPIVPIRRGIWLAAAVFAAMLAIGLGFLALSGRDDPVVVDPPPDTTTTAVTTTTSPPTTLPPDEGGAVAPDELDTIEAFVDSLNDADATVAAGLVAGEAGSEVIARIPTAATFLDRYDLGECLSFTSGVRCEVRYTDFFTNQLDLDPWVQEWEFDIDESTVVRLEISGENLEYSQATTEFEALVADRNPAATPLLEAPGSWVRSAAAIEAARPELVEFAALRSGIPPEAWATIAAYFEVLSAGDLVAFEALLAPNATFDERSGPNGENTRGSSYDQPAFLAHFWFEYVGLQTDTVPLKCTGDAASVSCRARNTGVLQLDTGGFEDGLLLFDLEGSLLTSIRDRFPMPDLGNMYNPWIFENGPDMTGRWSGSSADIPETPEVALFLLEWYPRYLADTGFDVPPEYLDGSLLPEG